MKRGQQKCIPTPGIQQRMHLFGAYRWEEDTLVWKAARRRNSQAFIEFLEHLFVERYPIGRFILVLDNASFHKSAASLAALSFFEHRVTVIWLPAYCSELNPIDRFWRYLFDFNPFSIRICEKKKIIFRSIINHDIRMIIQLEVYIRII